MNLKQLYELVSAGEQRRNVEIKRSMSWDDPNTKAKIVKATLAMSNIRDGGYLILGLDENNGAFEPTGMLDTDFNSYSYDDVKSFVSTFADPYVEFSMETVRDDEKEKTFLLFTINEFEEMPVICKRDGLENLRQGDIYTRSRRMSESVRVPTQSEMREIITMAVEKGIRKFIETSGRAGVQVEVRKEEDEYNHELEEIL